MTEQLIEAINNSDFDAYTYVYLNHLIQLIVSKICLQR